MTNVLVTGIPKYNDRKAAERCYCTFPPNYPQNASVVHGVAFDEVRDNKDDKVADGDQSDNTCVFQRVQPPEEGQGYNDEPKGYNQQVSLP